MAKIVFYEKPSCGTNARQKRTLEAAGHTVIARNLLTEPWTAGRLRGFFGNTPVASWFNPAAPRVKSGEVNPSKLDAASALALMIAEPLLIRRPLVEAEKQRCTGFEGEPIPSLLGGGEERADINACLRINSPAPCPGPDDARQRAHS